MTAPSTIVALVPDLMDRSKVAAAGADRVRFVPAAAGLAAAVAEADPALVVVDLGRPGVLDAVAAVRTARPDQRVIGFGSHVDRDLLDAAAATGCEVLARSAFFARLEDLLA